MFAIIYVCCYYYFVLTAKLCMNMIQLIYGNVLHYIKVPRNYSSAYFSVYIIIGVLNKLLLPCLGSFSTYEVATACALAIGADKLICIVDGQIFDEHGRVIHFMSIEEADKLIRKRAAQSATAANYVKVVDEEGINPLHKEAYEPSLNERDCANGYAASFQNGLGFNNGNGIYSTEQGFAISGEEQLSRSNGYLSELTAAAYVCHVSVSPFTLHLCHVVAKLDSEMSSC
jgi:hypothetical protein